MLSGQYIGVLSFARFEDMLNVFDKTSALTHVTTIAHRQKGVTFARCRNVTKRVISRHVLVPISPS